MKIAIITDIHEDIVSLKEALRRIEKYKCDEIICLGDISGYSVPYYKYIQTRNAHECLALIRSNCKMVILGNHDIYAGNIIPENCSFFEFPKSWYQLNYQQRLELSKNTIWLHEENDLNPLYTDDDIEYLRSLKEYGVYETVDLNILFSHYVYPNISGIKKGFYTNIEEFQEHFGLMESLECKLSFTGHSHVRGFYTATKEKFKQYRYKSLKLSLDRKTEPIFFGIPPITGQENRNGFCIFDVNEFFIQVVKL